MSRTPSEPRLSATVLLLRDAPNLQVLMVKRHYEIDFAAGALVFPGGKSNEEDHDPAWANLCDGTYEGVERVSRISAIREAFEEAGLLIARPASNRGDGQPLVGQAMADKLGPSRSAVDRGEQSFLALMREYDLILALDTLIHFGHWITPVMMPKRFDTHFYLASTPPGQVAEQDGRETTEAVWLGAQEALDLEASGDATIIFPTRMNLGKLAEVDTVFEAETRFRKEKVITVLPQVGEDKDGTPCLHIPVEAGYTQVSEPLLRIANVAKSG
ncbi:MAG: NUDIX hydrolase [Pseudomonadota bacterium]